MPLQHLCLQGSDPSLRPTGSALLSPMVSRLLLLDHHHAADLPALSPAGRPEFPFPQLAPLFHQTATVSPTKFAHLTEHFLSVLSLQGENIYLLKAPRASDAVCLSPPLLNGHRSIGKEEIHFGSKNRILGATPIFCYRSSRRTAAVNGSFSCGVAWGQGMRGASP